MTASEPFTLETPHGAALRGALTLPDRPGPRPAVVLCHGFKGFFEWGFFPYIAESLAERGLVAVRFNFSGAGMRPGDEIVTDLEAFRNATLTRDLAEVLHALEAACGRLAPARIDPERIALLGHSRGGGMALLAAAAESWREAVRCLVTWAAVGTFDRFSEEETAAWRSAGEYRVVNARTGQELAVGRAALDDFEARREELDLEAAAGRRETPWLIVHGEADETVPAEEARRLHAVAAPPAELHVIPQASHTFGAQHPFTGPTPHLIEALNATQAWLLGHLE